MPSHRKQPEKKDTVKIAVFGGRGVGKSKLTDRFAYDRFIPPHFNPGLEEYYRKKVTVDGDTIVLDVLDLPKQEEERLAEYYYILERNMASCDAVLFVYAIDRRESLEEIDEFVQKLLRVKDYEPVAVVLCGNKIDLESERTVSTEEGMKYAETLGCPFVETSAKTGENVLDAFITSYRCVSNPHKLFSNGNDNEEEESKKKCIIC